LTDTSNYRPVAVSNIASPKFGENRKIWGVAKCLILGE